MKRSVRAFGGDGVEKFCDALEETTLRELEWNEPACARAIWEQGVHRALGITRKCVARRGVQKRGDEGPERPERFRRCVTALRASDRSRAAARGEPLELGEQP